RDSPCAPGHVGCFFARWSSRVQTTIRRRPTLQHPRTRALAAAVAALLAAAGAAAAAPTTSLDDYVLFAEESLHARTVTVDAGDVGVNDGLLYLRGAVEAPQSAIVGDIVHLDSTTTCAQLFANSTVGDAPTCRRVAGDVPHPMMLDVAGECGFPSPPEFACS